MTLGELKKGQIAVVDFDGNKIVVMRSSGRGCGSDGLKPWLFVLHEDTSCGKSTSPCSGAGDFWTYCSKPYMLSMECELLPGFKLEQTVTIKYKFKFED